jgi:hypothetical protein
MKTLINLTATETDAPKPAVGMEQVVLDEVSLGDGKPVWYRQARLSQQAIIIRAGTAELCIPLQEIWKLVESVEPALRPPTAEILSGPANT